MDPPRQQLEHLVQVAVNGHGGAANGVPASRLRPLTVDEALQYSPLTTSTSYGLSCISFPDVGPAGSTSHLVPLEQRQGVFKALEDLERNNRTFSGQLSQFQLVGKELTRLLDGENLSEYKFKPSLNATAFEHSEDSSYSAQAPLPQLSPLANMILESTNIDYRYPTPSTPSPKPPKGKRPSLPTPPTGSKSPSTKIQAQNQAAFYRNNGSVSAQGAAPSKSATKPLVVIPGLPSSSQRSDYETLPDSPKRRKLDRPSEDQRTAVHVKAQKEEADAALQKFQDLLLEVFEAEDQLQPDTSMNSVAEANTFFEPSHSSDDLKFVLNSKTHSRLQTSMKKLVGYGRFADMPVEYVKRLQKLCEAPIIAAQTANLKIEADMTDDDLASWLEKVHQAEIGATSAATVLWTMVGSSREKELCPEDVLQCVPNVLTNVFENCIVPCVESRPNGKDAEIFATVSSSKEPLIRLVHHSKKVLDLFASLCSSITIAEGAINTIEFLAAKLIFVENGHIEKESALGFHTFEGTRRSAMDVLARIFANYTDQREFILDEILTSLEKLPSTKQSARQFKLSDNKNIQLLSALFVQLVQTTSQQATKPTLRNVGSILNSAELDHHMDEDGDEEGKANGLGNDAKDSLPPLARLVQRTDTLYNNAARSAKYIINYFVGRAMKSTKTGDEPYRNLLDLFVGDLITILNSTDWPASELLLRILAFQMISIAENEKSAATAKNMALELLGLMGSAISTLKVSAQSLASGQDDKGSDTMNYLKRLMDDQTRGSLAPEDLVGSDGPYRMTLEYLQTRDNDNWQLTSARSYYLVHWAKSVCSCFAQLDEDYTDVPDEVEELAGVLLKMLANPRWLETDSDFPPISAAQGRLAYQLTVLSTGFCKAFDAIVRVLLNSISSDQAKVRSRSLKSVVQMLETDPSLLDRDPTVLRVIMRCATDASPMVRDSALSLIGKCLALQPNLVEDGYRVILRCSADPTIGVRKRCLALLKDIYASASKQVMKVDIAEAFLQRNKDLEESVSTVARQTLEEIWFQPFYRSTEPGNETAKGKVALSDQVALMVQVTQRTETVPASLESWLKSSLSQDSKAGASNFRVCQALVSGMFEDLVDDSTRTERPSQASLLNLITVFAKANAKFFAPEQLQTLQPYIANLAKDDDLILFRSVVVIFRCVLPYVSTPHSVLLQSVQNDLFRSVAKLSKFELDEVMGCLWTIDGVLRNTDRLAKLLTSVLKGIFPYRDKVLTESGPDPKDLGKVRGYVRIAGSVGKNCDLDSHSKLLKETFPTWKGGSVAGLITDLIVPLTASKQPFSLRSMALESIGSVCQSWPAQFNKEPVRRVIAFVFTEGVAEMQNIVLKTFVDFFGIREHAAESFGSIEKPSGSEPTGRFGVSLRPSEHDNAAALIAQEFLKSMLRVATSAVDAKAFSAIQVVASINRQGLVHPKECAGTLVALETSPNDVVANLAYETHKMVHQQHETMFEREYMRATQEAFCYQRDVIGDPSGSTFRPFKSKLAPLFDIVKISNSKYVKKFLSNIISKVNFEPSKLDLSRDPPEHLLYARFLVENLAFFEYGRIDELMHAVSHMEGVVGKTGADISHAIDTDIFQTKVAGEDPFVDEIVPLDRNAPSIESVDGKRLRHLTTAAMILSMLWESRTHLRRQYGLSSTSKNRDGKAKDNKDLAKAPTKVHGVTGDKFWEAISNISPSLDSPEAMMSRCQDFVKLMSIDDEVKVAAENGDDRESTGTSIEPEDGMATPSTSKGLRGKRKNSISVGGTPKRPRGRPPLNGRRKSSIDKTEDGGWD